MQIYSDKKFTNPVEIIDTSDMEYGFKKLTALLEKGLYLLGYINYDFTHMYFEGFKSFEYYEPENRSGVGIITKPLISKED